MEKTQISIRVRYIGKNLRCLGRHIRHPPSITLRVIKTLQIIVAIPIPIRTMPLQRTIGRGIIPIMSTKHSIFRIGTLQWRVGWFGRIGHHDRGRGCPGIGNVRLVFGLCDGINFTLWIFRVNRHKACLTIGTFLGGARSTPRLTAARCRRLLKRRPAKEVTLEIARVWQIDGFTSNLIDIPQRIGRRIGQHEVTTRQVDITRLTSRTIHIRTMPSLGGIAPRIAHPRGLGVVRAAEHFIGGISVFVVQRERVGGHADSGDVACVAGGVGEAGVARDEALVVGGGGAPLAFGAGVGLDVGEGGAAEEFVL